LSDVYLIGPKYIDEGERAIIKASAHEIDQSIDRIVEKESKSKGLRLIQLADRKLFLCCRLLALTMVHDPYGQGIGGGAALYIKEPKVAVYFVAHVDFNDNFSGPVRTFVLADTTPPKRDPFSVYVINNFSERVNADRMANYVAIELQKLYWAHNPYELAKVVGR
jgi:hypothetical protein